MSKIRSKNTKSEILIFRELRKQGIYFRKHYAKIIGNPDIAIPREKKAIFMDGDFWHGYNFSKLKKRLPKKYWLKKIENNIARDKKNRALLKKKGWKVLRVWEHDIKKNFDKTIEKIIAFLKEEGGAGSSVIPKIDLRKCAKKHVIAIIENEGKFYVGSDWCRNPQKECPRKLDEGYAK